MNDYENGIITGSIGLGVDYYKGEKGDKPVKGVDYFTKEDIDEIAAYIEGDGIDLSDYAKKEDVEAAIADITFPAETDPVFTASAAAAITPADISSWNSKSDFSGDYEDLTNKPTIPTKTSELTNDSDFVAQSELTDYATKDYVEGVIAGVETGMLKRSIVSTLPSSGIDENTIYMVERSESESGNVYDEYMYVGSSWEKIGSTDVDLTDYWKKTDLTFTNGLTESNGTVSWNLFGRIRSGNGERSILEGTATNAGVDAHAEGEYTKATGVASHAEGELTTASGYGSHAEGKNTTASGQASHTEGAQAVASGADSHAEGLGARAIGDYSHAEGQGSYAMGECSHAEGQYTSATGHYSHAEGKYNVGDNNNIFQNIAGNGTSSARSNSFARDWNGNEYLAGDLFVNCSDYATDANGLTTENAGGSKVATESYVDQAIADIPTGGGSEYTAGVGIDIDSNNVIRNNLPLYDLLRYMNETNTSIIDNDEYTKYIWKSDFRSLDVKQDIIAKLLDHYIVNIRYSPHSSQTDYKLTVSDLGFENNIAYYDYTINSPIKTMSSELQLKSDQYYYWDGQFIYIWKNIGDLTKELYVKYNSKTEKLYQILTNLDNRVPAVPTADGNYKLTTSISSGTATTEWAEDSGSSGGASYTAGNGIEIKDNTLNTIPFPVFQALFSWNNFYYTDTNNTALITSSTDEGDNAIQELLKGKMILISSAAFSNYTITPAKLGKTTAQLAYIDFDVQGTYITSVSKAASVNWKNNAYHYYDGNILYIWTKATTKPLPNLLPVKIGTRSVEGLGAALQRHENKIGLPTLPSGTDGDYKLTATVADGSTTTQWVEDSGSGSEYTGGVDDLFIASIYSQLGLTNQALVGSIAPLPTAATADEFIELSKKGVWFNNKYGNGFVSSDFENLKSELGITNIRQININSSGVNLSTNNYDYNYSPSFLTYRFYKVGNVGIFVVITNIQDIKKLGEYIKNNIPAAPTADGSYKLTSTTTSGSSTYSWVADSSTSYTAGNGISIDSNGVISLDLSSAEGVGF